MMCRLSDAILGSYLLAAFLSGCATAQRPGHGNEVTAEPEPHDSGLMSRNAAGGQMPMMDMLAMCNMHQKMMDAKTPEERQAMMAEHMKNMSPEMWERRMVMMRENCK